MVNERIVKEMHELELRIGYHFNDIFLLAKAMGSIKIEVEDQGKNSSDYRNESLATVGDTFLKYILADKLYTDAEGTITKREISDKKASLESNKTMHKLMSNENLIGYAYNELHFQKDQNIPEHEKVKCNNHDPYIEAIIGAVLYDSDMVTAKKWVLEWLVPLLEKYKVE